MLLLPFMFLHITAFFAPSSEALIWWPHQRLEINVELCTFWMGTIEGNFPFGWRAKWNHHCLHATWFGISASWFMPPRPFHAHPYTHTHTHTRPQTPTNTTCPVSSAILFIRLSKRKQYKNILYSANIELHVPLLQSQPSRVPRTSPTTWRASACRQALTQI